MLTFQIYAAVILFVVVLEPQFLLSSLITFDLLLQYTWYSHDLSDANLSTTISVASSASFSSLKTAVEVFNNSVTQDRRDLLIDKQTNVHVVLGVVQEDLKKRFCPGVPQSKRTQIWRNIKSGLEKFCQVVHHYSAVMDVLVSAHPEIAALACT